MFFGKIKKYFESLHQTAKKSLEPLFRPLHSFLQKYNDFLGRLWRLTEDVPWIFEILGNKLDAYCDALPSSRYSPFYYVREYGDYPLKLLWEKKFLRYAYLFSLVMVFLDYVLGKHLPFLDKIIGVLYLLAAIPITYFALYLLLGYLLVSLQIFLIRTLLIILLLNEYILEFSVLAVAWLISSALFLSLLIVTKVLEYLVMCILLVYAATVGSVKS